jgi:glutamate racemase
LLALACSTTSAAGLPQLANELFLPTLGAVYPGLEAALLAGGTRIGVLGTAYTAASSDYTEALARLAPDAQVFVQKAQLLSALLDDGSWDGELMGLAIRNSLAPLLAQQANVIVLGDCSLSVLRGQVVGELAAMSGSIVPVVDPVEPMASAIAHLVESRQMATSRTDPGKLRIVLTDLPANLSIAERFFGRSLAGISVKNVDL